jgi:hypothetical protein
MSDLVENPTVFSLETQGKVTQGNMHEGYRLYPETSNEINMEECNVVSYSPSASHKATREIMIIIPGAIVHLIDKQDNVELASGDFILGNVIAVFSRVGDDIQWLLAKDDVAVKLDAFVIFPFVLNIILLSCKWRICNESLILKIIRNQ